MFVFPEGLYVSVVPCLSMFGVFFSCQVRFRRGIRVWFVGLVLELGFEGRSLVGEFEEGWGEGGFFRYEKKKTFLFVVLLFSPVQADRH